jgi:hypothetical protein
MHRLKDATTTFTKILVQSPSANEFTTTARISHNNAVHLQEAFAMVLLLRMNSQQARHTCKNPLHWCNCDFAAQRQESVTVMVCNCDFVTTARISNHKNGATADGLENQSARIPITLE